MMLNELLEGWVDTAPAVRLSGICLDNHSIEPGEAFVAVQGQLGHGLDYAQAAVMAGAVAVIHDGLQPLPQLAVPTVKVDGLGDKLGELASRYFGAPSEQMMIAGVTGTNGKTSVAHFLAQSWQRVYGNAGMIGTLGYGPVGQIQSGERTTPDAIRLQQVLADCLKADVERLAMEVSSHALQQQRCQTVQFDAAIFTNLTRDHLDYHGEMAAYAAAKRRLFSDHAPAFAIINHDDELGRKWFGELNGGMQMLSFGLREGAELRAVVRSMDINGMNIHIDGPWGSEEFHTSLLGEFNASNLLAAAGTLALLGMPWSQVLHQLEVMQPVPGRMMRLGGESGQPVLVAGKGHETWQEIGGQRIPFSDESTILTALGDAA